jgi:hypothetical protein
LADIDWTIVISAGVAAGVAIFGYIFSAWRQRKLDEANHKADRELEKAKTKYIEKLRAYEEIQDAMADFDAYFAMRSQLRLLAVEANTPESLFRAVEAGKALLMVSVENARRLDDAAIEERLDTHEEYMASGKGYSGDDSKLWIKWLHSSTTALTLLLARLQIRYVEQYFRAFLKVDILSDREEVLQNANRMHRAIEVQVEHLPKEVRQRTEAEEKAIQEDFQKILTYRAALLQAMRDDLQSTL